MHGELVVVDDVYGEFADRVVESFHARPLDTFSMALSGGDTARQCYERLAADAGSQIDWWKVDVYWGDERCVPADDPDSNYHLARQALLDRVGAANASYPMRCEDGPEAYQLRLADLGRIDLVHLGLGPDGHTASLFAQSPALHADPGVLVTRNADPSGHNPHERMTFTYAGIERARLVLVTVVGGAKHEALARVVAGDSTAPATAVDAAGVVWIADRTAAGDLA